ncbi:iron chelate uptake ABC transporter family permease subunit [Vibrio sonorensis]|uniref:iron chelate uptake ABC transporter family permease subunit n=1 Tax=Vibrio sonorensis TaxID=1004316 RepID=UPI0008DAEAE9|nr:iron chelate uptake ABC transporter family permease subunit [Vibrio sonorensis]
MKDQYVDSVNRQTTIQFRSSARFHQRLAILFALVVALLLISAMSLFVGAKPISPTAVIQILAGETQSTDSMIIWQSRLPRTITGILAGASLAVAGTLIQALTRNPLADPGILGVNSGASFFVLLGVVLFSNQTMGDHLWFAFGGALLTSLFVYFVGTYREVKVNPLKITLAGVALGALLAGISSAITLTSSAAFDQMRFWDAGSLDVRDLSLPVAALLPIAISLTLAVFIAPAIDNLSFGDEIAQGLGTNVTLIQTLALITIALLCGSATAIAGPIGFVGLMIPHVARRLSGPNQFWLTAYSIVLGPLLLVSADMLGRVIATNEVRVSVVTAFVGAPVLIFLARKVTSFGKL